MYPYYTEYIHVYPWGVVKMAKEEKTTKKSVNDFRRLDSFDVNNFIFNVLNNEQYTGSLNDGSSIIENKEAICIGERPLCHFFNAGQHKDKKCAVFSVTHDVQSEIDSGGIENEIANLQNDLSEYKTYINSIDSNEPPARNLFIPLVEKKWKEAHLTLLQIRLSENGKVTKVTLFDPKGKIPRCFYPKDHIKQAIKKAFHPNDQEEIKFEECYLGWQGITDTVSCGDKTSSLFKDVASSFGKAEEEGVTPDKISIGDTLKNVKKEIIDEENNFLFKFLYKLFGVPEEKIIEKLRAQHGIDDAAETNSANRDEPSVDINDDWVISVN